MIISTTTDLKAIRILLGLDPSEAGALIGKPSSWIQDAERGRRWFIDASYARLLLDLEGASQDLIRVTLASGLAYAIVYTSDDVYRAFETSWPDRIPSARLHTAAMARAKSLVGTGATPRNDELTIVTMFPQAYLEFLEHNGRGDDPNERQRWAAAFVKSYRTAPELVR